MAEFVVLGSPEKELVMFKVRAKDIEQKIRLRPGVIVKKEDDKGVLKDFVVGAIEKEEDLRMPYKLANAAVQQLVPESVVTPDGNVPLREGLVKMLGKRLKWVKVVNPKTQEVEVLRKPEK